MSNHTPERDPRRLSDLLRGTVPAGPDPAGRAADVVRRARRGTRRRGAVSVLAVGVVAAALIVTPHLVSDGPTSQIATSPDPTLHFPPLEPCLTHQAPSRFLVPASDRIPAGAVQARICPVYGPHLTRWSAPQDALTTDVSAVADAYNSQPKAQALPCAEQLRSTGFTVTFEYPGGRLVRVSAQSDGDGVCDRVSIDGRGDLGRSDAAAVMSAFFHALVRQRSTQSPPPVYNLALLTCPTTGFGTHSLVPSGPKLDLIRGIACRYDPLAMSHAKVLAQGRFTPDQVRSINADYAARATTTLPPGAMCMNPAPPNDVIVGQNAWGDVVELVTSCYVYKPVTRSRVPWYWPPSTPVSQMIDQVLAR